ncbi:alpha/beta hydrolase [Tunturiibacter empetritectus]|uniref:Acetyl esterase n=1 Tax=Tunturiibacter lichenicola TaxID=2051959 RepID=A0A852VLU1_9BACT|nr:alpha/beta hydrolase [Edaphobacter lichenicola]NYF91065.1 acetyl esterase [Edaphobacter lichenicola]
MTLDAKIRAILDAGKALGRPPVEQQTPEEARTERAEMMARFVPMPEYADVRVADRAIAALGIAARTIAAAAGREIGVRVFTPVRVGLLPVVVFFHGGGWVAGTLETHDPYCRALAKEAGVVVVAVDFRLAPEHKFPAGLEDCVAVTEWVLEHAGELGGDGSQVMVGGDSAGGTLATVVALLLRDKGVGGLAGQILLYPAASYYDPPTPSYLENAEGYGLTRRGMIWFWDHYLNDKSEAADFRVAPLLAGSLAGLPRAFVVTAEYDVLRDEGQAYARRMEADGVEVTHVFAEGMNHGFAASANEFPLLPQAKEMLGRVAAWVKAGG